MILAIRIVVAYIIGEYVLQTNQIIFNKHNNWRYMAIHICTVFLCMVLCTVGFHSWSLLGALFVISMFHAFDGFLYFNIGSLSRFTIEQFFHLLLLIIVPALFGIWDISNIYRILNRFYYNPEIWIYSIGYGSGVLVARPFIGKCLQLFCNNNEETGVISSLADKTGMIERMIVITFALLNQYTAIGILFAIKGVARKAYAEESNVRGELYFLGTSLSFFIAIITALFIKGMLAFM